MKDLEQEDCQKIVDGWGGMSPTAVREFIRQLQSGPDHTFWHGLDFEVLKATYADAPESRYKSIVPIWDLREEAIQRNNLMKEYLTGQTLYIAERSAFLRYNRYTDIYTYPTFSERSSSIRLLRVIGHWQRGDSLTPPIFHFFTDDQTLIKQDGHHRTAITMLSKAPWIPFYCKEKIHLDGIIECPAEWRQNFVKGEGDFLKEGGPWTPHC